MLELMIAALLTMAAGASVVTQQALNAQLKGALDSAAWAGFVSYFVGFLCMAVLVVVMREPMPSWSLVSRVPVWAWSGGIFGGIFIIIGIVLIPRIGTGTYIALVVAGQMLASLAFDHFGLFGLAQRSADMPRLLGAALLVAGVVLIRR